MAEQTLPYADIPSTAPVLRELGLIAPEGADREEAAARVATIETLSELLDRYAVAEGGIAALDALDADGVRELIELSVTNYVNARFQQELVIRIERGTADESEANTLMLQIREYIAGIVRLDMQSIDVLSVDWSAHEGRTIVTQIFQAAYALLGEE